MSCVCSLEGFRLGVKVTLVNFFMTPVVRKLNPYEPQRNYCHEPITNRRSKPDICSVLTPIALNLTMASQRFLSKSLFFMHLTHGVPRQLDLVEAIDIMCHDGSGMA